jgi:serine protease Do
VRHRRDADDRSTLVKLDGAVDRMPSHRKGQMAWDSLGVEVVAIDRETMRRINPSYDGGLRIVQVRSNSPAERENLRVGDVLVAMAEWKTESIDNLEYILRNPDIQSRKYFKFYIFRNTEPLYGQIRLAQKSDR